jgi:molybdate transport system substrate-binding protein
MKRRLLIRATLSALALSFTLPFSAPVQSQQQPIIVFAAASMKNALDEAATEWTKANKTEVKISYASSSALAKQMENGAPADIFISADLKWMDYVAEKKLIKANTRQNLLGNTLVLIARKDSKFKNVKIGPAFDLAGMLGKDRLALGQVDSVPAGIYAKSALEKLGIYKSVEDKLAQAENVRVALAYVSRGEAPLGIVYGTDAAAEPQVIVIGTFPSESHPAILYPAAQIETSKNPKAAEFLKSLNSPSAQAIFRKYGFAVLASAKAN